MKKLISSFDEIADRPTRYTATEFEPENAVIDLENRGAWVEKDENGSTILHCQDESIPIDDDKALRKFFRKQGYLPKSRHLRREMSKIFRQCVLQSNLIGFNT